MNTLLEPIAVLPALVTAAYEAASEVMAVYRTDHGTQQKTDGSPVTQADLRADRVIRTALNCQFPGVPVWSEESGRENRVDSVDQFFLVDPLDGTKEFIARNGEFTVNIALIRQGIAVAGVVHAPAIGRVFCAATGYGAWTWNIDVEPNPRQSNEFPPLNARALRVRSDSAGGTLRVLSSRSHRNDAGPLESWLATQRTKGRNCVLVPCGSSLKFCRIAQGQADAYPRFGPTSQWDTAAGQCVLEAAGGFVLDMQGNSLQYGMHLNVINPDFIASGLADL